MKVFRVIFVAIFSIIVLLTIFSLFLPSEYSIKRSIFINAKPQVVAGFISDLKKWQKWTAWNKDADSTVTFTFEGMDTGVGTIQKWDGEYFGKGKLEITKYVPDRLIEYRLDLSEGEFIVDGRFLFDQRGSGTEVTWSGKGDLSWNPMHKIFGLFMDDFMGPDYENGLAKLKILCEQQL